MTIQLFPHCVTWRRVAITICGSSESDGDRYVTNAIRREHHSSSTLLAQAGAGGVQDGRFRALTRGIATA
jgi:hypothetical protein